MEAPYKYMRNELVFPVLLEISHNNSNPFWQGIFENIAYGKSPSGCYITGSGFITCGIKNKELSYCLRDIEKSPIQIEKELILLFQTRLNLMSSVDKEKKYELFMKTLKRLQATNLSARWTDIRRKNIKELLIEMYFIMKIKARECTVEEAKKLLRSVSTGLIFKFMSNDDIVYSNGKIRSINMNTNPKQTETRTAVAMKPKTEKIKVETNSKWLKFISL